MLSWIYRTSGPADDLVLAILQGWQDLHQLVFLTLARHTPCHLQKGYQWESTWLGVLIQLMHFVTERASGVVCIRTLG